MVFEMWLRLMHSKTANMRGTRVLKRTSICRKAFLQSFCTQVYTSRTPVCWGRLLYCRKRFNKSFLYWLAYVFFKKSVNMILEVIALIGYGLRKTATPRVRNLLSHSVAVIPVPRCQTWLSSPTNMLALCFFSSPLCTTNHLILVLTYHPARYNCSPLWLPRRALHLFLFPEHFLLPFHLHLSVSPSRPVDFPDRISSFSRWCFYDGYFRHPC